MIIACLYARSVGHWRACSSAAAGSRQAAGALSFQSAPELLGVRAGEGESETPQLGQEGLLAFTPQLALRTLGESPHWGGDIEVCA